MYNIPDWCHHLLLTARMFVKSTLESYLDWYIGMKIEQVTQEHRLVGLIKLLEGKIKAKTVELTPLAHSALRFSVHQLRSQVW